MAKVTFPAGYMVVETGKRGREGRDIGALFSTMKEPGEGFILPELDSPGFKNKPQKSGALGKQIFEYAKEKNIPVSWDVRFNALKKDYRVMVTRLIPEPAAKPETAKS